MSIVVPRRGGGGSQRADVWYPAGLGKGWEGSFDTSWTIYGSRTFASLGSLVSFTLGTDYVVMGRLPLPSIGLFLRGQILQLIAEHGSAAANRLPALILTWSPAD